MDSLNDVTKRIIEFRENRDWMKFHNPKDLAISLVLEANEFMEHFQWKNESEIKKLLIDKKEDLSFELADVLYWILLISHDFNIDILESLDKKMTVNERKYPLEKSKGVHTKYTDL